MAHASTILQELLKTGKNGASTSELCALTGIASRSSVYHATRDLMLQGLVRGERSGHNWRFFAVSTAAAPAETIVVSEPGGFAPVTEYAWQMVRADAAWQARYLQPLISSPRDRAWLMHRLSSPCSRQECELAEVMQHTQPLRDLLYADALRAAGERSREDAMILYYNRLFGLPETFGLEHTWRDGPANQLRLPGEPGRAGWTGRHLKTTVSSKRQLRKAEAVVELLNLQLDILLYTQRHVLVVQVYQPGSKVSLKQFELLRRYTAVLEQRLARGCAYAFVVERPELLPASDLLYIRWADVFARLGARENSAYEKE